MNADHAGSECTTIDRTNSMMYPQVTSASRAERENPFPNSRRETPDGARITTNSSGPSKARSQTYDARRARSKHPPVEIVPLCEPHGVMIVNQASLVLREVRRSEISGVRISRRAARDSPRTGPHKSHHQSKKSPEIESPIHANPITRHDRSIHVGSPRQRPESPKMTHAAVIAMAVPCTSIACAA